MIVKVTYVVKLEVLEPITQERVENAFALFCEGTTSYNDWEVEFRWEICDDV